jgi:hypothetical protein
MVQTTSQGTTTTTVDCGTRCEKIIVNLRDARNMLADLVGDCDEPRDAKEPSNRIDQLELWLDNLASESQRIVVMLRELTQRIG